MGYTGFTMVDCLSVCGKVFHFAYNDDTSAKVKFGLPTFLSVPDENFIFILYIYIFRAYFQYFRDGGPLHTYILSITETYVL